MSLSHTTQTLTDPSKAWAHVLISTAFAMFFAALYFKWHEPLGFGLDREWAFLAAVACIGSICWSGSSLIKVNDPYAWILFTIGANAWVWLLFPKEVGYIFIILQVISVIWAINELCRELEDEEIRDI